MFKNRIMEKTLKIAVIIIIIGMILAIIGAFIKIQKIEFASVFLLISMFIELSGIILLVFHLTKKKITWRKNRVKSK